jgi:muconolactone delta-isomerase
MSDRNCRWLLLIHQIPPKPNYLRVKIGRRLQKLGAVAVKNSVYALPNNDEAQEQFAWVAREIAEGGGDTSICESSFVGDRSDHAVEELFNRARAADFAALAVEARELKQSFGRKRRLQAGQRTEVAGTLARLRRRLGELLELDFFGAPGREPLEALLAELEARVQPPAERLVPTENEAQAPVRGAVWVTRKNIHVDRIASAWLIRRFIDPDATFKFVPGKGYSPRRGELRFDMFEAEYTHEGDRCTFETLMGRFQVTDPALAPIAEIVHDIDVRDGKFDRPEVAGIERLITGIASGRAEDDERLAVGSTILDSLYDAYKRRKR